MPIPEMIFDVRSSEDLVCIPSNCKPMNWSNIEKVFLNEIVLSSGKEKKALLESASSWTLQKYIQPCPILSSDDNRWEQYDKCKASNQQFQD